MAHHFGDNVHTKSFTPREYQVELLDAAKERNIIVCLGTESGKSFIAMKLIQEMANDTRRPLGRMREGGRGGKNTLYLVEQKGKSKKVSVGLRNLTDLTISNCWCHGCNLMEWSNERWLQEISSNQVLVMGSKLCYGLLKRNVLSLKYVNLLIMDQCHRTTKGHPYTLIMQEFYHKLPRRQRPRILGLTAPLLLLLGSPALEEETSERVPHPGCLEARLERLEKFLDCTAETASDIVSLLRYCPRPRELVVEWSLVKQVDHAVSVLSQKIESELTTAWTFLQDHRYDPMEIYQDAEFIEELSCIPDPKIDPVVVLKEFLHILRTLGPWCADRAALLLLIHLDKLKVKTPYERHFLLLCMMTTIMVKIRGICELTFQEYKERERIYKFSSPKVLRFLEILREFLPRVVTYTSSVQSVCGARCKSEVPPSSLNCENAEKEVFQTKHESIDNSTVASCIPSVKCDEGKEMGCENLAGEGTWKELDGDLKKEKPFLCESSHHCVCTSLDGVGKTIDPSLKAGNKSRLKNCSRRESVGEGSYSRERRRRGGGGRGGRGGRGRVTRDNTMWNRQEFPVCDSLCGIVFVDGRFTAKILYHLLNDLRRSDPSFAALAAQYTVGCSMPVAGETLMDPREAEAEYRKQEEVLKRFRTHECNLLIGPTGWALEDGGLELPRCNLVLRFDHDSTVTDFSPPLNLAKCPSEGVEGTSGDMNCGLDALEAEGLGEQNVLTAPSSAAEIKTLVGDEGREIAGGGINDIQNGEIENSLCDANVKEPETNDTHDGSDLPITHTLNKLKSSSLDEADELAIVASIASHTVNAEVVIAVSNNAGTECMKGGDETEGRSAETKKSTEELRSENVEVMGQLDECMKNGDDETEGAETKKSSEGLRSEHCEVMGHLDECMKNGDDETEGAETKKSSEGLRSEHCEVMGQLDESMKNGDDETEGAETKKSSEGLRSEHCEVMGHLDECMKNGDDETEGAETKKSSEELRSEHCEVMGQLDECIVRRIPVSYHSYVRSRARARAPDAHHIIMAEEGEEARRIVDSLAHFMQIEEMLLRRCKNREPPEEEEVEADGASLQGDVYCPATSGKSHGVFKSGKSYWSSTAASSRHQESPAREENACVTLSTAIALVNRYCAKLPSDTFTRLTPLWSLKELKDPGGHKSYVCSLRLPINSPVKQDILGHRMSSRALARRSAALEACKILHQAKELDDDLMPVGKESFRAEVESEEEEDEEDESEDEEEQSSKSDPLSKDKSAKSAVAASGSVTGDLFSGGRRIRINHGSTFNGNWETGVTSGLLGDHSSSKEGGILKEQSENSQVTDNISVMKSNQEIVSEVYLELEKGELQSGDETMGDKLAEGVCSENELLESKSKEIKVSQSQKTQLNGVIQSNNFKLKVTCDDCVEKVSLGVVDLKGVLQAEGSKECPKSQGKAEEEDFEEVLGVEGSVDRPRPGTTKRRQYYYKRTADALTDCRPLPMHPAYLYNLGMNLVCPLPDEQNTRGRRIHPPEDSPRGFGILTLKEIPKICAFPIFTRSGEVRVCLEPCEIPGRSAGSYLKECLGNMKVVPNHVNGITLPEPQQILLTEEQLSKALAFLNYTFAGVLRLQRYLMAFDPVASENSYLIVPTMCNAKGTGGDVSGKNKSSRGDCIAVDWDFVDLIYSCKGESKPVPVDEEQRQSFMFEASLYHDAVVMPWYRNQDQPQYFYVAEICTQLSPKSSFPGSEYKTFEEYYFKKYAIQICNREQPLLDVDHTSARLNFLTPRYVNRKGVALPTSSEETKRAKRESLEQKQILVPELCSRHPFPASLWRKAVCLPCILYRLNALLLADQLRARVARDINLGLEKVPEDFEWPPLDFGWSLADVLKKSKESDGHGESGKGEERRGRRGGGEEEEEEEEESSEEEEEELRNNKKRKKEKKEKKKDNGSSEESERNEEDWMEIGTWSNEMAVSAGNLPPLPHNVTMVGGDGGGGGGWGEMVEGAAERIRYGSPSIWKGEKCGPVEVFRGLENDLEGLETGTDSSDEDDEEAPDDDCDDDVEEAILIPEEEIEDRGHHPRGKLRIQFKSDFLAEAVEVLEDDVDGEGQAIMKAITEEGEESAERDEGVIGEEEEGDWLWGEEEEEEERVYMQYVEHFDRAVVGNKRMIEASGMLLHSNQPFSLSPKITQETRKLENTHVNDICNDSSMSESNILCEDDDQSDSLMTSTENAEFISVDSLSDDDCDVFLDVLDEDGCGGMEESDKKLELKSRSSGLESPCLSPSCSLCSCRSSCSSCSSLSVSSEEESSDEERTEQLNQCEDTQSFSFDAQPPLDGHPGPSPPLLLQALTMSNANDGINLERLETIGDSFLKYAITAYLYCTHHSIHEGKLSHLRSKQVSNVNLYRLGKKKRLGESMIAAKFEPHDNWLPPCYHVPLHLERALIRAGLPPSHWNGAEVPSLAALSPAQIGRVVREKGRRLMMKTLGVQDSTPAFKAGLNPSGKSVTFEGNLRDSTHLRDHSVKMGGDCDSSCLNENGTSHDTSVTQGPECCLNSSSVLENDEKLSSAHSKGNRVEELPCFVPYNLVTQQSIPDKSIADCVEALIGAYLIACGPRGALLFMAWLGIRVLPSQKIFLSHSKNRSFKDGRPVGCMVPKESLEQKGELYEVCYGTLAAPPPPLVLSSYSQASGHNEDRDLSRSPGSSPSIKCKHCLRPKKCSGGDQPSIVAAAGNHWCHPTKEKIKRREEMRRTGVERELKTLLCGLSAFEKNIGYLFRDRSLLLQALTHASYSPNRLTDCYQRLEFLGDAVLDYLITRHLYEDPRQHSPGALTDLRSALVNNTIFASLAVRHGFHRFFLHLSPGLHSVVERFVRMQASNGHAICEEYYLIEEEECEEAEDVEVPKALGDVFESVAGAIFLDSGMSLDAVWNVYYRMMKAEIEQFSTNVPKSPIRELLEMEPETAKFGKPEKLADGRRVRVTVEVFGKGTFKGIGRNYRIAKCTAAKCALRQLKKRGLLFPRKN